MFRYALGAGERTRPLKLVVNGEEIATLDFPSTESWTTWTDENSEAVLKQGDNVIRLESVGKSGGNIDHLQVIEP